MATELRVQRDDFRTTSIVHTADPVAGPGEIVVRVDKFALTANNVSYALTGDQLGYWKFFPVPAPWGLIPVWGFGDVIQSNVPEIAVGERLYGYFPTATHLKMQPSGFGRDSFLDASPHRDGLADVYNRYTRTKDEPAMMRAFEDERCLFFPLFATSWIVSDYLLDHGYFGVTQVVIGSASSKTGFGMAQVLKAAEGDRLKIIGLTSPRNAGFVEGLGFFDQVATYDDVASLDRSLPTAFVDMSGAGDLVAAVHMHFADNLRASISVGATHWNAGRHRGELPGAKHEFFFAPSQFAKRAGEWGGVGAVMARAMQAAMGTVMAARGKLRIERITGAEACAAELTAMVDGKTAPDRGLMMSLNQ